MLPSEEVTSAAGTPAPPPAAAPPVAPPEAPVAPATPDSGLSFDNLDALVRSALNQPEEGAPPVVDPAAPAAPAAPAPEATPAEEEFSPDKLPDITEEELAAPPADAPAPVAALEDDPAIKAAIEGSPRLKLAWNEFKKSEAVAKPYEEGGIGHVPTTEQQRAYYESWLAMESMREHFTSEDPAVKANWLTSFFGAVDGQGQPKHPEAIAAAKEMLRLQPKGLAESNPEAFREQINTYGSVLVNDLLRQAQQATDPGLQATFFNAARGLSYRLTGKYPLTAEEQAEQAKRQPTPQEMELQRRAAWLENEQRRIAAERQNASASQVQQNLERVTVEQNRQLDKDVRKALEKSLEGLDGEYQEFLVERFKSKIRADVDRDQHRKRIVLNHGKELAKAGAMSRIADHLREYRTLYVKPLVDHTNQFRREAAERRGAIAQRQIPSPERAAQLATSAQNVNPGGAAARPGDPVIGTVRSRDRAVGESLDSFIDRAVRANMSVTG